MNEADNFIIDPGGLEHLLEVLRERGYRVIGPAVRDGAIIYDEISSTSDLPQGWTDEQDGGTYRLKRRSDEALFGYVVGPHSWKKFLHPPRLRLFRARRTEDGFQIEEGEEIPRYAFIGVRSCELHAIAVQDRVFMGGKYVDPSYRARRENAFILAVNCTQAGGTCFCASMNTGPKASFGFDLALTEIIDDQRHRFLVKVGSELGAEILSELPHRKAEGADKELAEWLVERAAQQMGRSMDTKDIKELLYRNLEHPRWEEVAKLCLSCGNCTMVCPTCFCTTVEDTTDLKGDEAERVRVWDSCFTMDFSYIFGGSVRTTPKARYRQWLTHKLATWIDQFGTSGCVGCGRCITWCPVGIDITEEVRAIRATDGAKEGEDGES